MMEVRYIAIACMLCVVLLQMGSSDADLAQFCGQIVRYTRRGCLNYNNYGCWCGNGGSGPTLDGVDRCCKTHDLCYIRNSGCNPKWRWYPRRGGQCTGSRGSCGYNVCKCDEDAARCFARNSYNSGYKGARSKGRC
ncbi:unnamed protein product [Owenia fusiformis]|uniref:Phospholipase A2 n=1 Tax=Owenia fusiformis TaxID=6347 RepID=A0A8S4N472_OWEFU|nr:unnamed protein product [Owenia fusiformis]